MAKIYASKFGVEVEKMASRLWGEHFFSAKSKKWTNAAGDGAQRAFNQFVMDPILKVKAVCDSGDFTKLEKKLRAKVLMNCPAEDPNLKCVSLCDPKGSLLMS